MKYEYKRHVDLKEKQLNELGEEGWELVSVMTSSITGATIFYMKRKLPTPLQLVTIPKWCPDEYMDTTLNGILKKDPSLELISTIEQKDRTHLLLQ